MNNIEKKKRKPITSSQWQVLSLALLGVVFLAVFAYVPMFGVALAFKSDDGTLNVVEQLLYSDWVGLENFKVFLTDKDFFVVFWNTLGLNFLQLIFNFPAPIIFALMLNEILHKKFKKMVQVITYFPYFISWVVFGGIILSLLDTNSGIVNTLFKELNLVKESINFGRAEYFWGTIIITSIIKGVGWGSIIYMAAITGIDACLYEAAEIDGAGRWGKMWYVTLPCIKGTVTLFLVLSISGILNNGFDHIWTFQNQINLSKSEVIDTFVFKYGISDHRYPYATAVGLFKSVISLVLLLGANKVSKMLTGEGIY